MHVCRVVYAPLVHRCHSPLSSAAGCENVGHNGSARRRNVTEPQLHLVTFAGQVSQPAAELRTVCRLGRQDVRVESNRTHPVTRALVIERGFRSPAEINDGISGPYRPSDVTRVSVSSAVVRLDSRRLHRVPVVEDVPAITHDAPPVSRPTASPSEQLSGNAVCWHRGKNRRGHPRWRRRRIIRPHPDTSRRVESTAVIRSFGNSRRRHTRIVPCDAKARRTGPNSHAVGSENR